MADDPLAAFRDPPTGADPLAAFRDKPETPATRLAALQAANAKPLNAPTTYDEGFNKSLKDTAWNTGVGILHGVKNAVNPVNIAKGAYDMASTGAQLMNDPVAGSANVYDKAKAALPGIKALSDPEAGGQAIGNLLVGGIVPRVAPHVPAALEATGNAVEKASVGMQKGSLPGGVLTGVLGHSPYIGAATAIGPYVGEYAGKAMSAGGRMLGRMVNGAPVDASAADPMRPSSVPMDAPVATSGLSATDRASLVKQGMDPAAIDKLDAQMQAPAAAIPKAPIRGTLRMTSQASSPALPPELGADAVAGPMPDRRVSTGQGPGGIDRRGTPMQDVIAASRTDPTLGDAMAATRGGRATAAPATDWPGMPESWKQFTSEPDAPSGTPILNAARGVGAGGKVSIADIATKSKRSPSSTPGLTTNDLESIMPRGMDPSLRITGLTQLAKDTLLANRAARAGAYSTGGAADAAYRVGVAPESMFAPPTLEEQLAEALKKP
jgi:hypothetical protein